MFTQEKHFFSCWNGGTHGMRNALYPRLKWLHRPVQCARFFLTRGQKELCESSSSLQGPTGKWRECSTVFEVNRRNSARMMGIDHF